MRFGQFLLLSSLLLAQASAAPPDDPADLLVTFMERYRHIEEKDVDGRIALAGWCESRGLVNQRIQLLTEAINLQPANAPAYRQLIEADGRRTRAVDKDWAEKLQALLGGEFHLHHSPHFTILHDTETPVAEAQAAAMEETYKTFYTEGPALGLRPMPPASRLVGVVFARYDDYRAFLDRFEGITTPWAAGCYSWRTNRCAFYHDRDNPVFKEVRDELDATEHQIARLRTDMEELPPGQTAKRLLVQDHLKKLNAKRSDMAGRLGAVSRLMTLGKARHEVTHQLLFNSGIFQRGKDYPFWLGEGLATNFEVCDDAGRAAPTLVNKFRLKSYREAEKVRDLKPLLQLIREHPGENDDEIRVAERYAQVWALTHFLWNRRPAMLRTYIEDLTRTNAPIDDLALFQKHFGNDLAKLDREFRAYMDAMK